MPVPTYTPPPITDVPSLWQPCGDYDAHLNTFPATGGSGLSGAVAEGDLWYISVGGTLGTTAVNVGDVIIAKEDAPGQTASKWNILNTGLGAAAARIPSADISAALAGTSGTAPSGTNKFVDNADTRNTDARTPTSHGADKHSQTLVETGDSRLSDARTPTAHGHTESEVTFDTTSGHDHNGVNSKSVVAGSSVDISSIPPQGRLWVPPAYIQPTGDAAIQLNAANDLVLFGWTQEVDCAYTSLSIYVTAVGTQGDIQINMYEADSTGVPTGAAMLTTTLDCGASADVWVRKTFDAVQCYRNKRYCIVFGGTAGDDFSLSCRRWNVAVGSMFPDGTWTKQDLGAGTWSDSTQNSKPALLNVILNSTAHHCPQLVYGRYNGKYLPCYDGASAWELVEIPVAGAWLGCEALTVNTGYNLYAYDNTGLTLDAGVNTTAPVLQDGVEVKSGATARRMIGGIYAIERQTGYQAPIDVMDWRGMWNKNNRVPKRFSKLCPYAAATSATCSGWTRINTDDYLCKVYSPEAGILSLGWSVIGNASYPSIGIAQDTYTEPRIDCAGVAYSSTYFHGMFELSAGLHQFWPLANTNTHCWLESGGLTARVSLEGEVTL